MKVPHVLWVTAYLNGYIHYSYAWAELWIGDKWPLYPLRVLISSWYYHVFSAFTTCYLVAQITLSNFLKFFFETIFILIKTRNIRCQVSILWRLPENKTKQTTRSQISSFPHDTIHMVPWSFFSIWKINMPSRNLKT